MALRWENPYEPYPMWDPPGWSFAPETYRKVEVVGDFAHPRGRGDRGLRGRRAESGRVFVGPIYSPWHLMRPRRRFPW